MVDAVGRNGFQATGLREVVALAGVSNRTFYENFDSMQDCFMAAFDEIVGRLAVRTADAYASGSGFPGRLRSAFDVYTELIAEKPTETHLIMVDLISLGAEGIVRRQQAAAAFETMMNQSFGEAPELGQVSELTVRAIVGGFQRVVYRRVRDGQPERLRSEMGDLLDWALAYQRPGGVARAKAPGGELAGAGGRNDGEVSGVGEEWVRGEQGEASGGRSKLDQRQRIIRAAAMITAERGYSSLSIPAITRAAKISNETFYENFRSTEEAFLKAIDSLGRRVQASVGKAVENDDWPMAVHTGLEALLSYLAENPGLARLLFVEAFGAGATTVHRVDGMLDLLSEVVSLHDRRAADGAPLPKSVIEAIPGGAYIVIQREILEGRISTLPTLAAELTFFVLAPFGAP